MSSPRIQRSQRRSRINASSQCVCLTVRGCIIYQTTISLKNFDQNNFRSLTVATKPLPLTKKLPFVLSSWMFRGDFASKPMTLRVKNDHRSKLSNWKEEAWKKIRAATGFEPVTLTEIDHVIFVAAHACTFFAMDSSSPAKNVWLVDARPHDFAKFKMAAISPSFVRRLIAA